MTKYTLAQFNVVGEEPSTHSVEMKSDPSEVSFCYFLINETKMYFL